MTVFWLDDVLEDKKMRYPFKPWHLPRKFDLNSSPCKNKVFFLFFNYLNLLTYLKILNSKI